MQQPLSRPIDGDDIVEEEDQIQEDDNIINNDHSYDKHQMNIYESSIRNNDIEISQSLINKQQLQQNNLNNLNVADSAQDVGIGEDYSQNL